MPASAALVLSDIFSVVTLVLSCLLLVPQAYQNYKAQSTEGLSAFMIFIWLVGSETPCVYYILTDQPPVLTAGWIIYAIVSMFILCQVSYYKRLHRLKAVHASVSSESLEFSAVVEIPSEFLEESLAASQRRLKWRFLLEFLLFHIGSAVFCIILYYCYISWSSSSRWGFLTPLISSTFPSIAFAVGFGPQIHLNFKTKSSEGLSVQMIIIDISACCCSIFSVFLNGFDFFAVLPFLVIIACQAFMLAIIFIIFPRKKKEEKQNSIETSELAPAHGEKLGSMENSQEFHSLQQEVEDFHLIVNSSASAVKEKMATAAMAENEGKSIEIQKFPEERRNLMEEFQQEREEKISSEEEKSLKAEKPEERENPQKEEILKVSVVEAPPVVNSSRSLPRLSYSCSQPSLAALLSREGEEILSTRSLSRGAAIQLAKEFHRSRAHYYKENRGFVASQGAGEIRRPPLAARPSDSDSSVGVEDSPPSRFSYSCVISTSRHSHSDSDDSESLLASRRSSVASLYNPATPALWPFQPNVLLFKFPSAILKPAMEFLTPEESSRLNTAVSRQLAQKLSLVLFNIN